MLVFIQWPVEVWKMCSSFPITNRGFATVEMSVNGQWSAQIAYSRFYLPLQLSSCLLFAKKIAHIYLKKWFLSRVAATAP